jgi:hypothetical protein
MTEVADLDSLERITKLNGVTKIVEQNGLLTWKT